MTRRFSLLLILALGLTMSACDTATPAGAPDTEATLAAAEGYDPATVARAADLDADLDGPVPFVVRVADRPLLRFDSADDLDRMSTALEAIAVATEEPLVIHAALAAYTGAEYDLAVPKGALSLTDARGRVVVGDHVYTIRHANDGLETVVTPVSGGPVVETFALKTFATEGRIAVPEDATVLHPDDPAPEARIQENAEDAYVAFGPDEVLNNAGETRYIWEVFAHSAYRTSFGAKKANAQSEVVASEYEFYDPISWTGGFQGAYEANTSEFDYQVTARVYTEHYGCKTYYGESPAYAGARIYTNAGGSRGTGQGVYKSRHTGPVSRPGVPDSRTAVILDGEDNDDDCWN